jgi:hypothetical protein
MPLSAALILYIQNQIAHRTDFVHTESNAYFCLDSILRLVQLRDAKRKVTLPSQTWTIHKREARVSVADCRTETAGIEKRLFASADRIRGWNLAYYCQLLADGAFLNGATREYRATEEVFGGSLDRVPFVPLCPGSRYRNSSRQCRLRA